MARRRKFVKYSMERKGREFIDKWLETENKDKRTIGVSRDKKCNRKGM